MDHSRYLVNSKTLFFLYLPRKLRCSQFIILDYYIYVVNRFFDLGSYLTETSQFQLQITINTRYHTYEDIPVNCKVFSDFNKNLNNIDKFE